MALNYSKSFLSTRQEFVDGEREEFDSLEEHLEKFVENIRQLGIIVSDFQPSSQTGLNQKL